MSMYSMDPSSNPLLHDLGERMKELAALHRTARILQSNRSDPNSILHEIIRILPESWQYPDICSARIWYDMLEVKSPDFVPSDWTQTATFRTRDDREGGIQVSYREEMPAAFEGPFLHEERELIETLAEMLQFWFQHHVDEEELLQAQENLETLVKRRTRELEETNRRLQAEVEEHRKARAEIEQYQQQLRDLAGDLTVSQARERQAIAAELHDHIGQSLAFMKMQLLQLKRISLSSGIEGNVIALERLLNRTITSTRSLTFEISPPVLYELGLAAALDWLAEHYQQMHGFTVHIAEDGDPLPPMPEEMQVLLFQCVRELLANAVKHAGVKEAFVSSRIDNHRLEIRVEDNGTGFDPQRLKSTSGTRRGRMGFGLFSVRERLRYLDGELHVESQPGRGTLARINVQQPDFAS
ncbi:hypothetical protein GF324_14550 [bacterium]|nr:hypothetical protein [bacterium]